MTTIHDPDHERRCAGRALRRWAVGAAALVAGTAGAAFVAAGPAHADSPCTTTITGTHNGAVVVNSGTTCIFVATVRGGVAVGRGATLLVEGSTIQGSVAASAASLVEICESHTGSIAVSASTGPVIIGHPDDCQPNTVVGSVVVSNNQSVVLVEDNTVSGSVVSAHNIGSPVVISGNHH